MGYCPGALEWKKIYLSIQSQPAEKRNLYIVLHSEGSKRNFIKETKLPRSKGGAISVEDEVVSMFPDLAGPNNEDFHEEVRIKRLSSLFHRSMKLKIKPLVEAQMLPTSYAKGTREE
jgi:hypothetical protein